MSSPAPKASLNRGRLILALVWFAGLGALAALAAEPRPPVVFLSAPLLGSAIAAVPEEVRDIALLTLAVWATPAELLNSCLPRTIVTQTGSPPS